MVTIPHPNVAFGDLAERMKKAGDEVSVPRKLLARLLDLYISFSDCGEMRSLPETAWSGTWMPLQVGTRRLPRREMRWRDSD
jgi:hypothetical protein